MSDIHMHRPPVVSVCIPAFTEHDYIGETIRYLKNQTLIDHTEIVVAIYDPKRDHRTANAVMAAARKFGLLERVRLVDVDRAGIGYARNMAARSGVTPVIASFDADTRFTHDDALERLVRPVFEGEYYWSCCQNYLEERSSPAANMFYDLGNVLTQNLPVACEPGLTIGRFVFERAGGYADTSLFEGRALDLKLAAIYGISKRLYLTDIGVYCSARRIKHMRMDNFFDVFDYFKAYRGNEMIPVT